MAEDKRKVSDYVAANSFDKKSCKGSISTNLDVTAGSRQTEPLHGSMPGGSATGMQNGKMAVLEKRSAEEAKYIPQFYDKEAASAEPSQHLDIF
ncbi:hypothetical protein T4B_1694 [Trichinella pseudospiralis]|uniref:Uncharacterized protein n=1 Tax=Trichinella pseudospiralis TaxID=6337 RepID=A0A0V1IW15_TRIPS|nr:hypothetical protein T4A_9168 [Trichinella pseudospiralis]KRZ26840.1 hypothetical protein T4B_1694 [Trichinella pseudospiralis]KRZ40326.1 hypothetical protein T4C_11730 [Trichinella pseudospiralis]